MDFSFILFIALLVSGVIILAYRLFAPRPQAVRINIEGSSRKINQQPVLLEFARALFPVILIVFMLRSFIVEPFRIPSGSMLPNLHIGDFILVNKFKYGIRLPVLWTKVFDIDYPERGDVMVFRYPVNASLNFIKRVVGLPGDIISYQDKRLSINGVLLPLKADGLFTYERGQSEGQTVNQLVESIADVDHKILVDLRRASRNHDRIIVPKGHYFVMGDNRDQSNDSRGWGFVPEDHIVGKAFFVWFSWKGFDYGWIGWDRIGRLIY